MASDTISFIICLDFKLSQDFLIFVWLIRDLEANQQESKHSFGTEGLQLVLKLKEDR